MYKKTVILIMLAALLFSLTACNSSLMMKKYNAKNEFESYAIWLARTNYPSFALDELNKLIQEGKNAIDSSADEKWVDNNLSSYKAWAEELVNVVTTLGRFEGLSAQDEFAMIKALVGEDNVIKSRFVTNYFGNYNGAVVWLSYGWTMGCAPTLEIIGGVEFSFMNDLQVYRLNDKYYTLKNAFELGFLTKDDLIKIAESHKQQFPDYYNEALLEELRINYRDYLELIK